MCYGASFEAGEAHMRSVLSFVLGASLLVAGCGTAAADLSKLPQDAAARARLCVGAANAYWSVGQAEKLEQAELDRRKTIEESLRSATGFDEFVPAAEFAAFNVETTRRIDGGNWLADLNQCKAGYKIGEAEPVPSLPQDPNDRLFACAVSSAIKARGTDRDRLVIIRYDPQAFHFAHILTGREGLDGMAGRMATMAEVGRGIVRQGAVDTFVDRCVEEYPTAAFDHPVVLPEDDLLRAGICSYVMDALTGGGEANALRTQYMPRALRLQAPIAARMQRPISPEEVRRLEDGLMKEIGALGPSTSIFAACEKAYLPGAEPI